MKVRATVGRALTVAVLMSAAGAVARLDAQTAAQVPEAKSKAHAKELAALLVSKKLETFAIRDPTDKTRFVAVLHIPGVQFLVVGAVYERPSDLDLGFYNKDFMSVYADLSSSVLAKSKVFVEDAICDGLVALPAKNGPRDSITIGTDRRTFDGDFVDPKKKDPKKISQEDYLKAFADADEKYDHLLTLLVDELKKPGL
jgi:hypothetical protein